MRFDGLFDDLGAQLEAELAAQAVPQRHDEERLRLARLTVRDRLAALVAGGVRRIRLRLLDGTAIELAPITVGRDWLAAELPEGDRQCVVLLGAVAAISLTAAQARLSRERMPDPAPGSGIGARIGVGVVLRDLARRRVAVDVHTRAESSPAHGTIDRVGADHLDLAVHERGAARRESSVAEHRVVAFAAITMLRL